MSPGKSGPSRSLCEVLLLSPALAPDVLYRASMKLIFFKNLFNIVIF
jgi:hypothetical protein